MTANNQQQAKNNLRPSNHRPVYESNGPHNIDHNDKDLQTVNLRGQTNYILLLVLPQLSQGTLPAQRGVRKSWQVQKGGHQRLARRLKRTLPLVSLRDPLGS